MSSTLSSASAALLIIDWQERLFPAMDEGRRAHALDRAVDLTWLSRQLEMPVLTSEQYPKGLGPTLPQLGVEDAIAKTTFSALAEPAFSQALQAADRQQIILVGMETHICVAQTSRDLLERGYQVWTVADCCLSRRELDWELGWTGRS